MPQKLLISVAAGVALAAVTLIFLSGCAVNGVPMRFNPRAADASAAKSWYIEGKIGDRPVSCSFIEFDERGDFIDFAQHTDAQERLKAWAPQGKLLVVVYCHGWKNNSQSGDVTEFNAFLAKLASSHEIAAQGFRVHGIYLSWRGNAFRPYFDSASETTNLTKQVYGEAIVSSEYHRGLQWTGVVPESLSYWSRRGAAEHKVSGLPLARAIFTYAAATKSYGRNSDNRYFVMGHSFGALMLEQSLGQAMTGALTLQWWGGQASMPFDLLLFVNSAAPAIYAKEMRDFLKAHRSALGYSRSTEQDMPVIISLTSTADWATGLVHPIGNVFAQLYPSLRRTYTSGIFGERTRGQEYYPQHEPVRQSVFYTKTPGHHPYLINHWIVKENPSLVPDDPSPAAIFSRNLDQKTKEPDLFFTSEERHPAAAWRITTTRPREATLPDGREPSMADSNYWIVSCGKELIGGHNAVWSATTMEMYAALFRAAEWRRGKKKADTDAP